MKVYSFCPKNYFGSNTYVLSSADEFAIVDPSVSYSEIAEKIPEIERGVRYILLTHAHFDHMLKISEWSKRAEEVIVGVDDAPALKNEYLNCYLGFLGIKDGYFGEYKTVSEGDVLRLGDDTISVISCPGHTPGGVAYRCNESLFVGDTVFADGGYGRCDLPGGDEGALEKSLVKIFTHQSDCIFYPGHGRCQWLHDAINFFM